MKIFKLLAICTLLALLLVPGAVFAQEQPSERGVVEFGFRGVTGSVYGRTDAGSVPFSNGFRPDVLNSALNTYNDYRSSFYVPKIDAHLDNIFGSDSYLKIQAANNGFAFNGGGSLSRDLSALITVGQYGHYKVQFRFDETPHIFAGTTRTLFTGGGALWSVNPALQASLYTTLCKPTTSPTTGLATCASGASAVSVSTIANTINSAVAGNLLAGVAGVQPFTQQENRKTITGLMSWNIIPAVNVSALFSREHQVGTRPIGFVMGNSSSGYVAEVPESINYYTNNVKIAGEFGQKHWDASVGYQGSFFQNDTPSMVVANPFSNVYNNTSMGPATGMMDQYPDNSYHQFVGQGAVELGKYIHLMANVTPGWLSQTANFQPLTTNTFVSQTAPAGYPAFLPQKNLDGKVSTLAMNFTGVFKATKNLKFVAKYQHYGYDNHTPELLIRPVIADTTWMSFRAGQAPGVWIDPVIGPSASLAYNAAATYYLPTTQSSFTSNLFDVGGTWFFTKKSSMKFGYQRGWMDRTNREVAESIEDSFYGALDMQLQKHLLLRVSARHQNRMPQGGVHAYEVDTSNVYARMMDQSTRVRNRGDVSLQWDATQKLSLSAYWGTVQDNFNQRSSVNSLVPLGDATYSKLLLAGTTPTPIYGPYYAYGLLTSIGRNYGFDVNYALTPKVMLFAEYGREKNTAIFIQGRGRNDATCVPTGSGYTYPTSSCDPINDLLTAPKDVVNSYYAGVDTTASKKLDFSVYYNLSVAQNFGNADGVNCQIGNGPNTYCQTHFTNWTLDKASNPAVNFGYPQSVNRIHEVGTVARFKLTENLVPKFQYIFRQYSNNDWQTGVINPYSFAGTSVDPAAATALQKILFLGADLPSYRTHIFTATLEYHF
jgi:hypothetical protein